MLFQLPAVVEEIFKKLPCHEELIWQVFENIQLGYVEDCPLKFIRFMVSRLNDMNDMNMNMMRNDKNNKYDTVVSGSGGYSHVEEAASTTGPVPMALAVAATAVAHQRACQLGGPARSTSHCGGTSYQGGCHLQADTVASQEEIRGTMQENMSMKNVQGEWDSSRNQNTDLSDFNFRIKAKEGAADNPHQPILVTQQREVDDQLVHMKPQAVAVLKTVLQTTGYQVRCREKQDHKFVTALNICLLT
jgi:hypothetical protein